MRYVRLAAFLADWKALPDAERAYVKQWLAEAFLPAIVAYEANPSAFVWPRSLRFEPLQSSGGICAVTWSFAGPDGRATFQFSTIDGEPCIVWRRIGHHDIYRQP